MSRHWRGPYKSHTKNPRRIRRSLKTVFSGNRAVVPIFSLPIKNYRNENDRFYETKLGRRLLFRNRFVPTRNRPRVSGNEQTPIRFTFTVFMTYSFVCYVLWYSNFFFLSNFFRSSFTVQLLFGVPFGVCVPDNLCERSILNLNFTKRRRDTRERVICDEQT